MEVVRLYGRKMTELDFPAQMAKALELIEQGNADEAGGPFIEGVHRLMELPDSYRESLLAEITDPATLRGIVMVVLDWHDSWRSRP
jgi:hypothetical protein